MYLTSNQKKAAFNIITFVMMKGGRITANKGAYWKKVAIFLNISDIEKSESAHMDVNECVRIIDTELSEENKAAIMAMIMTMAFADGDVQEELFNLLQKISNAINFGEILHRMGQAEFESIERRYAL